MDAGDIQAQVQAQVQVQLQAMAQQQQQWMLMYQQYLQQQVMGQMQSLLHQVGVRLRLPVASFHCPVALARSCLHCGAAHAQLQLFAR